MSGNWIFKKFSNPDDNKRSLDQEYNLRGTHPDNGVRMSLPNDNVYLQSRAASKPRQQSFDMEGSCQDLTWRYYVSHLLRVTVEKHKKPWSG